MNIFKDNNDWNEKSIIGFIAFLIMCLIMIADLLTGWVGKDLVINSNVYDSFSWVVLVSVEQRSFQVKNVITLVRNENKRILRIYA